MYINLIFHYRTSKLPSKLRSALCVITGLTPPLPAPNSESKSIELLTPLEEVLRDEFAVVAEFVTLLRVDVAVVLLYNLGMASDSL